MVLKIKKKKKEKTLSDPPSNERGKLKSEKRIKAKTLKIFGF